MQNAPREIESIALAMFASLPLYFTQAIAPSSLIVFHVLLALLLVPLFRSGRAVRFSPRVLQIVAAVYLFLFFVDGLVFSRSLIRASTHLLFFIVLYLLVEKSWQENYPSRILVAFLIFIASTSTATHLSISFFVAGFVFFAFRQFMHVSHVASLAADSTDLEAPTTRPALAYLGVAAVVAVMLFPLLPRARNPFVRGMTGPLTNATTGLALTIDFSQPRQLSNDDGVVARVSMSRSMLPFFTPVRLRYSVYDQYENGVWGPKRREGARRSVRQRDRVFVFARKKGYSGEAEIQQRIASDRRLAIPTNTYALTGLPPEVVLRYGSRGELLAVGHPVGVADYRVALSREVISLSDEPPELVNYPVTPEVTALARSIAGDTTEPREIARRIEQHLIREFEYTNDPAAMGRPMALDEFLLRTRRGHCEYFAAGMVVLLRSLGIPARVVGGFYGGEMNPLTGYLVIRQRDGHAWVEVWEGEHWNTWDPTPPANRPGTSGQGVVRAYLSAMSDSLNYFWDRYVLTFGLSDQLTIFTVLRATARGIAAALRSGGQAVVSIVSSPFALGLIALAGLLVVAASRRYKRLQRSLFGDLIEQLALAGVQIPPSMTAHELLGAVDRQRPDLAPFAVPVVDVHVQERFGRTTPDGSARQRAQAALKELRTRIQSQGSSTRNKP